MKVGGGAPTSSSHSGIQIDSDSSLLSTEKKPQPFLPLSVPARSSKTDSPHVISHRIFSIPVGVMRSNLEYLIPESSNLCVLREELLFVKLHKRQTGKSDICGPAPSARRHARGQPLFERESYSVDIN
jgi:hypothetical protein